MARSTPAQNDRGPASSTWRVPHAAAQRCATGAAARSERSAASPPETMPASGWCGVSDTARMTATGRPAAAAASGADSMSATSQPSAASLARCERRTRWSTVVIRPVRAGSPARRSSPARIGADAQVTAAHSRAHLGPDDQVSRAEVGGQAAAHAHDHHLAERTVAQLPACCAARVVPYPVRNTAGAAGRSRRPRRMARASIRSGAQISGGSDSLAPSAAGVGVARAGDGLRHALPPDVWAVTYRPSALRGKARRYRW